MPSTRTPPEAGFDSRAIHRTLTGLRDRLRLQEDELDRLCETIRSRPNGAPPAASPAPRIAALEARIDRVEQAQVEKVAASPPLITPPPALDQKALEDNIQERVERNVLPQMRALETQLFEQGKMLQEAFSAMGRTEVTMRRLIGQVDRLLEEGLHRPPPVPQHIDVTSEATDPPPRPRAREPLRPRQRERSQMFTAVEDLDDYEDSEPPRFRWKFPLAILALLIAILAVFWFWYFRDSAPIPLAPAVTSTLSPLEQARAYETDRNYPKAEEAYRELLAKDPTNEELIRHLASVLYREDKVDESAEIMKKLPAPAP